MQKVIKYFLTTLFLLLLIYNESLSQFTKKWEIVDIDTIKYYDRNYPIAKNISYIDKDDIAIIGYYIKAIKRSFYTPEQIKVEILTNSNVGLLVKYSSEKNKKEVIKYDTNHVDDHWRSISHPSKSIYAIAGDSTDFLGYFDRLQYKFNSLLLISHDGGNTWERKFVDSNKIFCDISMCDSSNGIIYQIDSSNYFNSNTRKKYDSILITNDCWKTFIKKALPENSNKKIYCISPNKFVVICREPENYKYYLSITTDGGNNWFNTSYTDFRISSFKYINDENIFVGGGKAAVALGNSVSRLVWSSDFGITWNNCELYENKYIPDWGSILTIDFVDEFNGIAAGYDLIYKTSDGGINWTKEFVPFRFFTDGANLSNIDDIAYPDNNFILAITDNGQINISKNEQLLLRPVFKRILDSQYQKVNNIKIQWSAIKEASRYRLKIDSTSIKSQYYDFDNPLIDTILTDTSIILNDLNYKTQYGGWIKALNDSLESDWFESRNLFSTIENEGVIYPPELIYPEQGHLLIPPEITLIWTQVPNADNYILAITDMNENKTIFYADKIVDTSYTYTNFQPSKMYFISLCSQNKDTISHFKISILFTAEESTGIEVLTDKINEDLMLYPNPVKDKFYFEIHSNFNTGGVLKIYNLLGELVNRNELSIKEDSNIYQINAETFPPGIYFVELIFSTEIKRGIFIKP